MSDELVDMLGEVAREAEAAPLPNAEADAMIALAIRRARREPEEVSGRGSRRIALAVAASTVLGLVLGAGARELWSDDAAALEAQLPTGDAMKATPGAVFEVGMLTERAREIELEEGTLLFDVVPLEGDARFEVRTRDAVVRVRGTVFSVEATSAGTNVRVYEGEVEVESRGSGTTRRVPAGRAWSPEGVAVLTPGPLSEEGRAAAARRNAAAQEAAEAQGAAAARQVRSARGEPAEGIQGDGPPDAELAVRGEASEEPLAAEVRTQREQAMPEPVERSDARRSGSGDGQRSPLAENRERPAFGRGDGSGTLALRRTDVERLLAEGRYEQAREVAARRGWTLLEADALRALGRFVEAARRYDRVASRGDASAAYAAARLRFRHLGDPEGALASLAAAPADSALEERILGLRARLLHRVGREAEARSAAQRYLRLYPEGGLASWMGELTRSDSLR